jgi:hypothetical protein
LAFVTGFSGFDSGLDSSERSLGFAPMDTSSDSCPPSAEAAFAVLVSSPAVTVAVPDAEEPSPDVLVTTVPRPTSSADPDELEDDDDDDEDEVAASAGKADDATTMNTTRITSGIGMERPMRRRSCKETWALDILHYW